MQIILHVDDQLFLAITNPLLTTLIVIVNVILYSESRRHGQEITAQQVSVEARENFLRQKRVLRLTASIVSALIFSHLTMVSFRELQDDLKNTVSVDTLCAMLVTAGTLVTINSFVNPLNYCARLRQCRVAFIE